MENKIRDALLSHYKTQLNKMFSDQDFGRFIDGSGDQIIKYSSLAAYKNINELLPDDGYKIILIESKKNSGHWTVLIKLNDTITFFDSYGIYPDDELNFVSKVANRLLGNKHDQIRRLMNTFPNKKMYSKTKYQSNKSDVNTCGRWCLVAIHLIYQLKYSLSEMKSLLDKMKKNTQKPYDILAVDFTS